MEAFNAKKRAKLQSKKVLYAIHFYILHTMDAYTCEKNVAVMLKAFKESLSREGYFLFDLKLNRYLLDVRWCFQIFGCLVNEKIFNLVP